MTEIDPSGTGDIRATIKYGDGYQAPWLTFGGSNANEVRQNIIEAYQLDRNEVDAMSLHELVIEAATIAQAAAAAVDGLGAKPTGRGGGKVLNKGGGNAWDKARGGEAKAENAEPEKSPEELEVERLTAEIAATKDVGALKRLWAENQAVFKANEELMAAWKARGKSLKSDAK